LNAFDRFTTHLESAARLGFPVDRVNREQALALAQTGRLAVNDPRVAELLASPGDDLLEIYEAVVRGAFELFETDLAVTLLDGWQADFPTDAQPHFLRGFYHEYEEQWQDAEVSFRRALELAESRIDVRLGLARALRKQNRFHEALEQYRICLTREQGPDTWFGIGECLKMQGALEQARLAYERGNAEDPENYDCLLALGQFDVRAGRGKDALPWVQRALEQRPYEFNARYALANAFLYAGETERATEHFQRAVAAQQATVRVEALSRYVADHPDDVEKRVEIGKTLLEYGQREVAVSWLRGVLNVDSSHQLTHALLADFYLQQGQHELAERHRIQLDKSK
jgi:tetratricopeptide (TPR) repeat protein